MQSFRAWKFIGVILFLAGAANLARAAIIAPPPPDFKIMMQVVGSTGSYPIVPDSVTPIPDGDKWKYQIDGTYNQHGYAMTMSMTIEPDPSVFGNVSIRNTTAVTQDYIFNFSLPIAPIAAPTSLSSSMSIAATADATSGAISSTAPDPVYSGLIDGVTIRTIAENPFTLPMNAFTSSGFAGSTSIPPTGPAANTNIGIKLHFNVTPGDQASITSQFTVNAVPEPASLLSLALGGLVLARRRK